MGQYKFSTAHANRQQINISFYWGCNGDNPTLAPAILIAVQGIGVISLRSACIKTFASLRPKILIAAGGTCAQPVERLYLWPWHTKLRQHCLSASNRCPCSDNSWKLRDLATQEVTAGKARHEVAPAARQVFEELLLFDTLLRIFNSRYLWRARSDRWLCSFWTENVW